MSVTRFTNIKQWEAARAVALRGAKKKEGQEIERRFQQCRPKWNFFTREYI